jgi:O-antigen/teichoic acid export membrane protein
MTILVQQTADSRHIERSRHIRLTAWSGLIAKAAMFFPTLAIAYVVLPIVGAERFGVLMTVLSLLGFLSLADIGIASSLVTSISRATGADQLDRVRQLQANGFAIVSGVALLLCIAGICVAQSDLGTLIFHTSTLAVRDEATQSLAIFTLLFALSLPLTLVNKVQLGLQRGHIANFWQIGAALVNFVVGISAALGGLGIPWIIAGMMSGTLACGVANLASHYRSEPSMLPKRGDINYVSLGELLHNATFYFALQLIFAFTYAADTLIVARHLGAEQASVYALAERIFSIVAVAVSVITGPLWAAYGEALGRFDRSWARRVLGLSTKRIALSATLLSLVLLLLLKPLINLLSAGHLVVPFALAAAMAVWRVIEAVGSSLSVYLFANQNVRFILIIGAATAVTSFVGKNLLLPANGLVSLPLTMLVCFLLLCLLPCAWLLLREDPIILKGRPK